MIELSKHIEYLLIEHNCVIVPQLGGFIAQDVPARYVAEENLFLPPHRTVGFNPQLTLNDGLLMQSFMQAYDTDYQETTELIDQAVTNLKEEIQEKGYFELEGIGKLTQKVNGQYDFEPLEAGILSPSLYGLDAVSVKPLEGKPFMQLSSPEEVEILEKSAAKKNSKNYTFSINKELANYVAAAVVAIVFYFIWATPVTDTNSMSAQQASMLFPRNVQYVHDNIPEFLPAATDNTLVIDSVSMALDEAEKAEIRNIKATTLSHPSQKEIGEAATSTAESQPEPVLSDNLALNEGISKKQEKTETSDESYYTIVLVSRVPLKNAERFANNLKNEGYNDASVLELRKVVRVVFGKYQTKVEAHHALKKLRSESERFQEAWIFKKS